MQEGRKRGGKRRGREVSWDGKVYDKYRVEHTDGTPLHGKKYFVLRLDSDDPVEAARVAAAMRAYKNEPRNCDVGASDKQEGRFRQYCSNRCAFRGNCLHPHKSGECRFAWAQMPYEAGGGK